MIARLISNKRKEILGINRRNQLYVRPSNPLKAKILADSKLQTKRVMSQYGIKTPELFKVVRTTKQLEHLDWESLPKSFVIKPNRGTTGSGIIVFYGQVKNKLEWIRPNGRTMNTRDLELHMEKILEGRFSMGNRRDIVLIEERVQTHPDLKAYSYKGVPDVRIIVYNKVPVMAMVRLPTKRSDGKANLHAGAICAGIDIASGITTYAMHLNKRPLIEDTYEELEQTIDLKVNLPLRGLKIPFWDEILQMAVMSQSASGVGYLGVDIVVDKVKGAEILELNARPGLGIQTANNAGLRPRLERVRGLKIKSVQHGIRVAKNLFGGEVEGEIEALSGKHVVNLVEKVTLFERRNEKIKETVNAMLDTGITTSRIDRGLASRLGFSDDLDAFYKWDIPKSFETFQDAQTFIDSLTPDTDEERTIRRLAKITESGKIRVRPVISVSARMAGQSKRFEAVVSTQEEMLYPLLIGRTELKDYLIDASKTFTK